MHRRGFADVGMHTLVLFLLTVLFLAGLFLYLGQLQSGAFVWEDWVVKDLALTVNQLEPGDSVVIDVHAVTEIAHKNDVADLRQVIWFDHEKREVCARLSAGRASCFAYFHDVAVAWKIELSGVDGNNVLVLDVAAREDGDEV